jgi:hypothetical protein
VTKAQNGDANYYRACAAEMMTKAQAAPSKAVRRAYLNLALKWSQQAAFLQKLEGDSAEGGPLSALNNRSARTGSPPKK